MLQPNALILYVDNLTQSRQFYQELLGVEPTELSPTFSQFTLSNGMHLGLKIKTSVEPAPTAQNGNGELAFTLENDEKADALFAEWVEKGRSSILQKPTLLPFGYTFLALDPDGNRLRFVSLKKSF